MKSKQLLKFMVLFIKNNTFVTNYLLKPRKSNLERI